MRKQPHLSVLLTLLLTLTAVGLASAGEQPRYGGVLTWLEYADPGRLDIHAEGWIAGFRSVSVGITIGALWGLVTGYFGGIADSVSQRVVDTLMGFPPLILALSLMAVLQQSVHNVIVTLAILLIPTAARTLRSTTLSLKEMGYIEAARAMGSSHGRIIFGHILPNSPAWRLA
ncbi:MAG: ABC transporter permease [Nitrospinae bacterium]|nr:ABC transporter permease [Nitrospinota bacterium]